MTDFITNAPGESPTEGLDEQAPEAPYVPSTTGDVFKSSLFTDASWLARQVKKGVAMEGQWDAETGQRILEPEERLPVDNLKKQYPDVTGIDEPLPQSVVDGMQAQQKADAARASIQARYPSGVGHAILGFGAGAVASMLDPVDDAAFMVPVVGEARYARWLNSASRQAGLLGRGTVIAGVGTARGTVGGGIIAGTHYALDPDMTLGDVASQTLEMGAIGGLFHLGGAALGAGRDAITRRFFGSPDGQAAAGDVSLHDHATRAAAGQMAAGQPVEVRPVFDADRTVKAQKGRRANVPSPPTGGLDEAVARAGGQPSNDEVRIADEAATAKSTTPEQVMQGRMAEAERATEEMRTQGLLTPEEEAELDALAPKEKQAEGGKKSAKKAPAQKVPDVSRETVVPSEAPAAPVPGPEAPPASPAALPPAPAAAPPGSDFPVADKVAEALGGEEPISAKQLQAMAGDETLASGQVSRDDLYDAAELGLNRYLIAHAGEFSPAVPPEQAVETAQRLADLKNKMPTQTVRAGEKETHQQFSTPPDYSYAASWAANLRPDDVVLEPSAGTGSFVTHALNAGVREVHANDISERRAEMLRSLNPTRVTMENAEHLHGILPRDVRPTVVLMNPPFSNSAGRGIVKDTGIGAQHVREALRRMEPGGRLVAIVGGGMKPDAPSFRGFWSDMNREYRVRANIGVGGDIYRKYGTTFPTRLLVIDKLAPTGLPTVVIDGVKDAKGLISALNGIRDERSALSGADQQHGAEPARAILAEQGEGGQRGPEPSLLEPTGVLGTAEGRPVEGEPGGSAVAGGPSERPAAASQEPSGRTEERLPLDAGQPERPEAPGTGIDAGASPEGSAGPLGGGSGGAGDGVRPDGSGERVTPGVTPAPATVRATEISLEPEIHDAPITDAVYEKYKPQRAIIPGAKEHPGALVQSAAMASVQPPIATHALAIPKAVIEKGLLSDAQLEAVMYAGNAHAEMLPAQGDEVARRRGFFIGDGCVAAGTRIYNPITKRHVRIERLVGKVHTVLALHHDGLRPALALRTFKKGVARLYRVLLSDGREITVTDEHRFLTPSGWLTLADGLGTGDALAVAVTYAPRRSPIRGEDAQNCWQKPQGFLGNYSDGLRQCDAPPLRAPDSDVAFPPSQAGAHEHNRLLSREDAPATSPFDTAHCLSEPHRSKRNSGHRGFRALDPTCDQGAATLARPWEATHQDGEQSRAVTVRPARSAPADIHRQSVPAYGLSPILNASERLSSGENNQSSAPSRQNMAQGLSSLFRADMQSTPHPGFPTGCSFEACGWRSIVSIHFQGERDFYDMYVPGPENYVAEGIINHNTGVGKGREVAGIILDNWEHGRQKHVWVSEKKPLLNDARRDWAGLQKDPKDIIEHGAVKAGDKITGKKGILFTTYDTLKSAEQVGKGAEKTKGKTRVQQIVDWLGKDFDGVIAFDEAHNLGNSFDTKGNRGVKKAAAKATAGNELQKLLPNARVVYVSATGATEVENLAYADRLGLWGRGTAFASREDFVSKIGAGGIAAMELVSRDMKALGHYIARNLSYDGVEYDRVEHALTPDQKQNYDKLADAWQLVLRNFNQAMEAAGIAKSKANGQSATLNAQAKSAILSQFWGGHQRFFNQVITSMQMPTVLKAVEKDIAEGRQAVLQLVNTNEAAQERALQKISAEDSGEALEDLDMSPRDQLMQLVQNAFPTQRFEEFIDENGNRRSRPVVDSKGDPVRDPALEAKRDALLDELGSVKVPDGPLEMMMNHFGTEKVAEVTGRKQRVVKAPDEKTGQMRTIVEKRPGQANVAEANAFQGGKKPILIFSEAGGTGRSYHADINSESADKRRSHYLVQAGWRADKAVQGFGRTHRTNQASAPLFHLVTTDLQGQKRFISSIARRLGQLGALTKGERRTGDQGLFGLRDNLESDQAKAALKSFYDDAIHGKIEGVGVSDLEQQMGLKIMEPDTGRVLKELPPMTTFLNRLLSLRTDLQNKVFDEFSKRLDDVIDRAASAGTLDTGVETYKADKITKKSDQVVYTDPHSGAQTRHVQLETAQKTHPRDFDSVVKQLKRANKDGQVKFIKSERSGKVFAVADATSHTDKEGRIIDQKRLYSPTDYQFIESNKLQDWRYWNEVPEDDAKGIWDQQVAKVPEFSTSDLHIITGAVLPIWDRLGGSPRIYRLQTDAGERMLGRVIPSDSVDATLSALGAEKAKIDVKPADVARRIMDEGNTARLANGWKIKRSMVSGEPRLELLGPDYAFANQLKADGVFSERIDWKTRFFIPTGDEAAPVIERITKGRPVTQLGKEGGQTLAQVAKSPDSAGGLPIRPSTDDPHAAADANFIYSRVGGNRVVPTDSLRGERFDTEAERERVQNLAAQMQAPGGHIARILVDDQGNVIEGQHRLQALRRLGIKETPVTVIRDISRGYDVKKLEAAAGQMHSDQVHGVVQRALELADQVGSPEKARAEYELPAPFSKPFNDVLDEMAEQRKRGDFFQKPPAGWESAPGGVEHLPVPEGRQVNLTKNIRAVLPDEPTAAEQRIMDKISDIAARIAPTADVHAARAIAVRNAQGVEGVARVWGVAHVQGARSLIAWSLEGPDAQGTFQHEALHFLKGNGFIKPEEWATLEQAVQDRGWAEKFEIDSRYPDATPELRAEEAIASAMGQWRRAPDWVPDFIKPIFEKVQRLLDQAGDYLRQVFGQDATANDVFSRIASGEIGAREPSAGGGEGDLFQVPHDVAPEELDEMAAAKRRLTLMQDIQKRQALAEKVNRIKGQGLSLADGFDALTRGTNRAVFGGRDSTAQEQVARQNEYLGRLLSSLERIPGGVEAWAKRTETANWVRELAELNKEDGQPGISKSPLALKIAQAVHDAQDLARFKMNQAGAWIGDYDGYVSRTRHNPVRIHNAGFEKWRDDTLAGLDWNKTFEGIEAETGEERAAAIEQFMQNAWDALSTGIHMSSDHGPGNFKSGVFTGPGNVARRASAERVLHWKDADSWRVYQEQYGDQVIERGVMDGLHRAGRDTALIARWGSAPQLAFENLIRQTRNTHRADHDAIARLDAALPRLKEEFAHLTGEASRPGSSLAWQIRGSVVAAQDISKLGNVLLAHMSVGATKPFQMQYQGIGRWQAYTSVLRNLAKDQSPEGRAIMENLRANATGQFQNLMTGYEPLDGIPGQLSKLRQVSLRLGGLPWMIARQKEGTQWELSNFLGQSVAKDFGRLQSRTQRGLSIYGIGPAEWDALRLAGEHDRDGTGSVYLTPLAASRADVDGLPGVAARLKRAKSPEDVARIRAEVRDRLGMKLAAYYADAADRSTITPGIPERAFFTQHFGRFAGPMVGQYKTWAMAAVRQMWGQAIYGSSRAEAVKSLAELVAVGTAIGYARIALTDAFQGKNPQLPTGDAKKDGPLLAKAMIAGGGLGIFGDYLMGNFSRYSTQGRDRALEFVSNLVGPAVGDIASLYGIGGDIAAASFRDDPEASLRRSGAEMERFIADHVPFVNAFYLKRLAHWLVIDRLNEAASPGYLQRSQDNVKRQTGQEFFLPPTQYAGAPH